MTRCSTTILHTDMFTHFTFTKYDISRNCNSIKCPFIVQPLSQYIMSHRLPVFEVLGLHLGHLSAGEVKDLLAEQLEDDHVVLTEALAGPTRTHDVTDESRPVFGPFLFQDLEKQSCV